MRVIGPDDVAGRLAWRDVVEGLREGHRGPAGQVRDQFLERDGATLLSRAAWVPGIGIGVKSVTVKPDNPAAGRPSVHGAMVLFDERTGAVSAVIDSALVTRWKTAADSLLGATLLAPPEPERLVILGAGEVADSLIEGYRAIFPSIGDIALHNRTSARAERLAARHGVRVGEDVADDVARADIVATATMSSAPVLAGRWLSPATHVDLIGAFTATMREADDEVMRRGRLFVDARETTLDHIGELAIPLSAGTIAREDVLGDLGDLVAGRAGRRGDEITVYKNGGGAHLDVMTAAVILRAVAGSGSGPGSGWGGG